jgi:hypothetical protein
MKRLLPLLFLILLLPVFPRPVAAQEDAQEEVFNFEKAYKDYIFVYENYKKAHSDYLLARSQYQQAQTLASQTKARDSTVVMLQARDDVVVTYLTMLRMKLVESEGISETDKEGLYSRLDSEITWYKNNKSQIPSAGTLSDLVKDSEETSDHFQGVIPLAYETLSVVPVGKVEVLRNKINLILSDIKTKTEEIRLNGDHDTQIIERWIIEAENKITRSLDKEVEAQTLIYKLQSSSAKKSSREENPADIYNQVVSLLGESNQFMREASSYMKEIVKQIKTVQS